MSPSAFETSQPPALGGLWLLPVPLCLVLGATQEEILVLLEEESSLVWRLRPPMA